MFATYVCFKRYLSGQRRKDKDTVESKNEHTVANTENETCVNIGNVKQMMLEMENRISLKLKKNMEDTWEKFLIRQKKSL